MRGDAREGAAAFGQGAAAAAQISERSNVAHQMKPIHAGILVMKWRSSLVLDRSKGLKEEKRRLLLMLLLLPSCAGWLAS